MWLPDVLLLPGGVRVAGGGTATVGPYGRGSAFNGTNQSIALGRDALSHGRGARIAWVRIGSASGSRNISAGGNGGTGFRLTGTAVEIVNTGNVVSLTASAAVSAGEFCALGISAEPFGLRIYKNGSLIASRGDISAGGVVNNADTLGQTGAGSQFWDGAIFMHASFSARLSDEDQAGLVQNPWQLFEPLSIWVPVSSGGAHGASGSLASAGSAVSGSASRSRAHAASGVLAASSAAVAGAASRFVAHAASGVLASAAAAVAGLAKRFRAHAATGVLAAGASAVAGAANRDTSGSSHTASGVLAVGSALVTGVARRVGVHSASGAMQADAAALSGAAARIAGPEPVTLATPPGTYFFWWRAAAASEGQ